MVQRPLLDCNDMTALQDVLKNSMGGSYKSTHQNYGITQTWELCYNQNRPT